jgi:hypothetical protein
VIVTECCLYHTAESSGSCTPKDSVRVTTALPLFITVVSLGILSSSFSYFLVLLLVLSPSCLFASAAL